jgi:hypothetical protein
MDEIVEFEIFFACFLTLPALRTKKKKREPTQPPPLLTKGSDLSPSALGVQILIIYISKRA